MALVILTQTVGQITDTIRSRDSATQTARPQTSLAFSKIRKPNNSNYLNSIDNRLLRNEETLRQQLIEMETLNEKLRKSQSAVVS